MKHIYFVLFFVLIAINSVAQRVEISIKSWKSYPIPLNEDTLIRYNHSKIWWKVIYKGNEVFAYNNYYENDDDPLPFKTVPNQTEQVLKLKGQRRVLKVDDGYLVGMYYGEWGGKVYWYANDGLSHKLIGGNKIVKFLKAGSRVYALDGYDKIIELKKNKEEWVVEDFVKLPSYQYPYAIAADNEDNFIVFTSQSLLKIDKERVITDIIVNGFWNKYLGPSSMVIRNNVVYAGMGGGIFKYNLVTKKKEWLMPK